MVVELEPVGPRTNGDSGKKGPAPKDPRPFRHLVIDCSSMAFVDPVGIKTFRQVRVSAVSVGLSLHSASGKE